MSDQMNVSIKTTGELREFLTEIMVRVKTGHINVAEAAQITKTAAQINESFYAETKIARTAIEMGQTAAALGKLSIK